MKKIEKTATKSSGVGKTTLLLSACQ